MSQQRHDFSVNLEIKTSKTALRVVLCLHGVAMLACWFNTLAVALKLLLIISLSASAFYHGHQLTTLKTQHFLRHMAKQGWQISLDGEHFYPVWVEADSFISRWLIVLHISDQQTRRIWPVFKDAVGSTEFRRLTVSLKIDHRLPG